MNRIIIMKNFFIILFCFFLFETVGAQNEVEFFPERLTIQPFTANFLEPKLGFLFHTDNNELRLDIGNSVDIIASKFDENTSFSFGVDLFTYTLLRKEGEFHFPVDAVDYLFGVNAGFKTRLSNIEVGARLRFSHISAHMADGHYDYALNYWRDSVKPRVYSREFIEFIPFVKFSNLRLYAGITYIFHIDPDYLKKDVLQAGFDYFFDGVDNKYLVYPFIAYDLRFTHINKRFANHSICAGIKFGKVLSRGISLYYQYYKGKSIHGEYFDFDNKYSAFGINLDL